MDSEIAGRVANGAAWLDENFPGWEREIDLATLDLAQPCKCVLGQLGGEKGHFWNMIQKLGKTFGWAIEHGFALFPVGYDEYMNLWDELDDLWLELIKERFSTGNLSDDS